MRSKLLSQDVPIVLSELSKGVSCDTSGFFLVKAVWTGAEGRSLVAKAYIIVPTWAWAQPLGQGHCVFVLCVVITQSKHRWFILNSQFHLLTQVKLRIRVKTIRDNSPPYWPPQYPDHIQWLVLSPKRQPRHAEGLCESGPSKGRREYGTVGVYSSSQIYLIRVDGGGGSWV